MKRFVDILSPGDKNYPQPVTDPYVHHEYYECGVGDWCLHEEINEEPFLEITTIPNATEPGIYFLGKARAYGDSIKVDTDAIRAELLSSGFDEKLAGNFAIVFHDEDTRPERRSQESTGWYNDTGHIKGGGDDSEFHPIAVHIIINDPAKMSWTMWHEFGHAHEKKVKKNEKESLYEKPKLLSRVRRLGYAAIGLGATSFVANTIETAQDPSANTMGSAVGIALAGLGSYMSTQPKVTLWLLDRQEWSAERFAMQRRGIKPITAR